jgi:hypothetical protein
MNLRGNCFHVTSVITVHYSFCFHFLKYFEFVIAGNTESVDVHILVKVTQLLKHTHICQSVCNRFVGCVCSIFKSIRIINKEKVTRENLQFIKDKYVSELVVISHMFNIFVDN